MTRTFDPDALPIGDEGPTVSIAEAIQIAKLKGPGEGAGAGAGAARKGKHPDPFFDGWEERERESEAMIEGIIGKLGRLDARTSDERQAKGWRRCEEHGALVPPGWFRAEEMRIEAGGPRATAAHRCPHCGSGLAVAAGER